VILRAAVLGSPIAHSLSPALHRAAYHVLGLDWDYSAIECSSDEFPEFFAALTPEWRGLSLTMPLKEIVLDVVDDVSDVARMVRSANTVYRVDEHWQATNTDIEGIERALHEVGVHQVECVHILGSGATARSAAAAAVYLGATTIVVHARRAEPAGEVAQVAEVLGAKARVTHVHPVPIDGDLVISTLPSDAARHWAADEAAIGHSSSAALLDVSYHPWPTPLTQAWAVSGGPIATGRDMLLWQALGQVALMTGIDVRSGEHDVLRAMRAALD
jgi:shikimate dehydrogenase